MERIKGYITFFIYIFFHISAVVWPLAKVDLTPNTLTFIFLPINLPSRRYLTNSQTLHPYINNSNNLYNTFFPHPNISLYWPVITTSNCITIHICFSVSGRSAIICFVLMPILVHLIDVLQMLKIIPRYSVYTSTSYTYNTHNHGNIYSIYVPLVIGWPPFHFLIYFQFMWQNHPT